ncbi:uncharacterized protein LOC143254372 [Tachypleus tridentatus]|uniref:uncharacterized protein LOC143254372 n=1 Tax=Tachypleus tridentatus TaxID=6853 RepID=UPI003FD22B47
MLSLSHNVLHLLLLLKLSTFPMEIRGNINLLKVIRQTDIPSDYGLPDDHVVQDVTVESLTQCVVVCMNNSENNCQGFDVQKLKPTERKCRISATKLIPENAVNIPNVRYYEVPESISINQPTTVTTPALAQQLSTLAPIVVKTGQMLDTDIDAGGVLNIGGVTSYFLFSGLHLKQYTGPNFFGLIPTGAKISDFFQGVINPLNNILSLRVYENGLKSIFIYDICPDGYSKLEGRCYKLFSDVPKTYEDARQHCVGEGGMLAAIRTTTLLTALWSKTSFNEYYWVGVRDTNTNNVWYFEDGTPVTDNTIWALSKPDNGLQEDCAAAGYKDPILGTRSMNLEDLSCSNNYKFFCETSQGPITKTVLDLTSGFLPISFPTLPSECQMSDSVTAVVDLFPTESCLYFTKSSVIHNLHGALFKYTELVRTVQAYVTTKTFPITAAMGYLDLTLTDHVVLFFGKEVITLDWDNDQKKWV